MSATTMQQAATMVSTASGGRPGFNALSALDSVATVRNRSSAACAAKRERQRWIATELDRGNDRRQFSDDVYLVRISGVGEHAQHVVEVIDDVADRIGQFLGSRRIGGELVCTERDRTDRDDMLLAIEVDESRIVAEPNRQRVHT